MITYFKNTEAGLEKMDGLVNNCWMNVIDPTPEDIQTLTELGIPQDFVTYPLDMDERARTEKEDNGVILIILRIPYFQGVKVDIPYTTIPMGIIITERFIVTICRSPNEIISEMSSGRLRGLSTAKRNRFVLRLLLGTANKFLMYLREINKVVDTLEDRLQLSLRNKELTELLKYQKSLVYFATALKMNELLLERLQRSQLFHMYPDDEDLLDDVMIETQQAIEMVNISSNILVSMMDAFASVISNNQNAVMKFLASATIVMSIPTIVTSFFGMNVNLPFEEYPLAFLVIIGIFIVLMVVVIMIFWKRDWF